MHFRVRGNNVQLIKSVLDEQAGRTKPTLVGSANLVTGQLNAKAEAALSEAEKAEVVKWLDRRRAWEQKKAEVEIFGLADTLSSSARWLPDMEPELARELVENVMSAVQDFRRAARRCDLI